MCVSTPGCNCFSGTLIWNSVRKTKLNNHFHHLIYKLLYFLHYIYRSSIFLIYKCENNRILVKLKLHVLVLKAGSGQLLTFSRFVSVSAACFEQMKASHSHFLRPEHRSDGSIRAIFCPQTPSDSFCSCAQGPLWIFNLCVEIKFQCEWLCFVLLLSSQQNKNHG